ncbi:unnamed protein product, partial [Amoebophrya sp. A120]
APDSVEDGADWKKSDPSNHDALGRPSLFDDILPFTRKTWAQVLLPEIQEQIEAVVQEEEARSIAAAVLEVSSQEVVEASETEQGNATNLAEEIDAAATAGVATEQAEEGPTVGDGVTADER